MYDDHYSKESQAEIERQVAESILRAAEARKQADRRIRRIRRHRRLGCLIFVLTVVAGVCLVVLYAANHA